MLGRFPIGALVLTLACASEEVELFELPSLAELPTPHLVEAATPLLAAARKTPEDPKALGRLAQVFEVASIWTPAERLYTRAAELDPSSEAWNYHAALCMQLGGEVTRGTEWLERIAPEFPRSGPIQLRLGESLLDEGRFEEARQAFARASKTGPYGAPILGLAEVDLAQDRALEAESRVRPLTVRDPRNARAWFLLGQALRAQGRLDEAEVALEKGVGGRRVPLPDAWSRKGAAYLEPIDTFFAHARDLELFKRHDERIEHLRSGRERFPTNGRIAVNLAVALLRAGELDAAKRELEAGLELGIESAEIDLAFASVHVSEEHLDLAVEAARRACVKEPGNVGAQVLRARLAHSLGDYREVLEAAESALAVTPGDDRALELAVSACLRLQRHREAESHLLAQTRRRPERWRPWVQLAVTRRVLGDERGADEARRRAQELAPDEPAVKALGKDSQ